MNRPPAEKMKLAVEGVPLESAWFQGGVSLYLREILSGFARDDQFSFHVFAKALAPEARNFLEDHRIPFSLVPGGSVVWRNAALQTLRREGRIAAAWFPFHTVGPRCPVPYSFTVHDFSFFRPWVAGSLWHRVYYLASFWLAAHSCRSILCVSQTTWDDLARFFPFWKRKAHVAPHGVPSDALALPPFPGGEKKPPSVLFFDAGNPRKRFDLFLRAAERPGFESWSLKATGDPALIRSYLRERGMLVPQNLTLLGKLPRQQLLESLRASDALAYLSDFEGFGFPILEALALQTPVVCLRGRAEREVGRGWAFYAESKDPQSVSAALLRAVRAKGTEKISRFGLEARQAFSWQKSFDQHRIAWGALTASLGN